MRSRSIPLSWAACSSLEPTERPSSGFRCDFPFKYALEPSSTKENINMTTLSYSVAEPALRSPVEEWPPHGKQSESTSEWWYLTALVHDVAGNPFFLVC